MTDILLVSYAGHHPREDPGDPVVFGYKSMQ